VHGSGHSVPASIHTGDFEQPPAGGEDLNLLLDKMNGISFDEEKMQVTVQAGCHLGHDPLQPEQYPRLKDSLMHRLDQKGWALPITGGIVRQAIGGFLSTGSAGGSLQHAFAQQLVAIRLIDGKGEPPEFVKDDDPNNEIYGVGLSVGLMGVITSVTIQCVPTFNIKGRETTSRYEACEIDLFQSDGPSGRADLPTFFRDAEYCRCMWWPQKGIKKLWSGRQINWRRRLISSPSLMKSSRYF